MKGDPCWIVDFEYRRKPKTNAQIACELLATAHKALEAHSVEICEPNVDHIQRMVWDAMELIQEPKQHTIVLTTAQLKEVVMACDYPSWDGEDFKSAVQILLNALNGEVK
jgi:chemotaxis regulatin CheY-phosphate phosphatase CheZ